MTDVSPLFKEYLGKSKTSKEKARLALLSLMLKLGEYRLIYDLGIARVTVYQSHSDKILKVKYDWL